MTETERWRWLISSGRNPTLGALTLIFAFEAVIIGGLGSLWGTLLGGMLLGVTQVLVSQVSVPYATLASRTRWLAYVLAAVGFGAVGGMLIVSTLNIDPATVFSSDASG